MKLIESNKKRAKYLAGVLKNTLVLHADEADIDMLSNEDIDKVDLFISATHSDEKNIIASLLAKPMGANRVITLIHKGFYADLLEDSKIDIVISLPDATIGSVLSHVRRGDVDQVHSLRLGASEVLKIVVHGDRNTSAMVGRRIEEINWSMGAALGAIVREDTVLMGYHDEIIQSGDHLLIFVQDKKIIPRFERLVQVSGLFA